MTDHEGDPGGRPPGAFPEGSGEAVRRRSVDTGRLLEALAELEFHEWELQGDDAGDDAALGPAAEEVRRRLDLPGEDESVTLADAVGATMAAVSELAVRFDERADSPGGPGRHRRLRAAVDDDHRGDLESLRERLEAVQATVHELRQQVEDG